MADEELELLAAAAVVIQNAVVINEKNAIKKRRKQRRWWTKPWIDRRHGGQGMLNMLHMEVRTQDPQSYENFFRLDERMFQKLLDMISDGIDRKDTVMRQCITSRDRLAVTLRFLASGASYRDLMYSTRIHESTISIIIPEVLTAIYEALKDEYLKVPCSSQEWEEIAREFEVKWNFPHCLGAFDGKHIVFRPPRSAGSLYYNDKGQHSIVMLALVDANYKFLYVDVGKNGRVSDGGVFRDSSLSQAIDTNLLNFPPNKPLPGQTVPIQYVIVADDAFPLSSRIMKPYHQRGLTPSQRIFNYRLSRARRVVENAFGILANVFRILLGTIPLSPKKTEQIVLTCVALHNYRLAEQDRHIPSTEATTEASENVNLLGLQCRQGGNRSSTEALDMRNKLKDFFNGIGEVPWQQSAVERGDY